MGEILSDLPTPTTPEELGELYDYLCFHPLGAFAVRGVTRQGYIQLQGQISRAITEPGEVEVISILANGRFPSTEL